MTQTPSPAVEVTQADVDALHNLIQLARPHFSDDTQELALVEANAFLAKIEAGARTSLPTIEEAAKAIETLIRDGVLEFYERPGSPGNFIRPLKLEEVPGFIRALSTPTSGEAAAPPPLSEQPQAAGAGHASLMAEEVIVRVRNMLDGGEGLSIEDQRHLINQCIKDRKRAALAYSRPGLREALEPPLASLDNAADGLIQIEEDDLAEQVDRAVKRIRQALGGNHD